MSEMTMCEQHEVMHSGQTRQHTLFFVSFATAIHSNMLHLMHACCVDPGDIFGCPA